MDPMDRSRRPARKACRWCLPPWSRYDSAMTALYLIVTLSALGSCAAPAVTGPAPTPRAAGPTWNELARQANAALGSKDFVRYRARLVELYRASKSSSILLSLARVDARVGDVDAAFAHLEEYAAMGLDADVGASPGLKDDPRWPALRTRLEVNRAPVARATTVFGLPHESLVAEGLAWDPRSRAVLIGSPPARSARACRPSPYRVAATCTREPTRRARSPRREIAPRYRDAGRGTRTRRHRCRAAPRTAHRTRASYPPRSRSLR